jgi:hypothetical protein
MSLFSASWSTRTHLIMLHLHLGCGIGLKFLAWTFVGTQEQGPSEPLPVAVWWAG